MIISFIGDGTRSCVMLVHGINKYVTEMSEETQENHTDDIGDSTVKPVVRRHLLRRSHHRIISGNGSTLNQESSTKTI